MRKREREKKIRRGYTSSIQLQIHEKYIYISIRQTIYTHILPTIQLLTEWLCFNAGNTTITELRESCYFTEGITKLYDHFFHFGSEDSLQCNMNRSEQIVTLFMKFLFFDAFTNFLTSMPRFYLISLCFGLYFHHGFLCKSVCYYHSVLRVA